MNSNSQGWRPTESHRDQISRRLRFCNHALIFSRFSFLCQPLRHGLRVVNLAEMATRKHCNVHNVEQTEKMVPFFTCETAFRQNVGELVFGINVFDLDVGSRLVLSNNLSSATLWVQDTCLIVRLLPLIIILITALLLHCPQKHAARHRSEKRLRLIPDVSDCFFVLTVERFFQIVYRDTSCPMLWVDLMKNVTLQ